MIQYQGAKGIEKQRIYTRFLHAQIMVILNKAANSLRLTRERREEYVQLCLVFFLERADKVKFEGLRNPEGFLYRLFVNKMRDQIRMHVRRTSVFPYLDEQSEVA